MTLRALDLFCGAGGASMGLHRAGFTVVGVDVKPEPRYPFEFHQADALTFPLEGFDLIWASPPCQAFTSMRRVSKAVHGHVPDRPDLLTPIRERLKTCGTPWIIENVPGAPMRRDVVLCGSMFGLRVRRHRWFETSGIGLVMTNPCRHDYIALGVYGDRPDGRPVWRTPGTKEGTGFAAASLEDGRDAMGIDWMLWPELKESIPPAYSEHLGRAAALNIPEGT